MTDPLEAYIREQSAGGEVDSSGSFSISWQEARKKLRDNLLPDSAHYVLKLVQAAVAVGAPEIHFRLSRTDSVCFFSVPAHRFSLHLDALLKILMSDGSSKEAPLRHLAVALNAGFMDEPRELFWGTWRDERCDGVRLTSESMERLQALPHPYPQAARDGEVFCLFKKSRGRRLLLNGSAQEHALLAQRTGYSPVPVVVDGKAIESPPPRLVDRDWHQMYSRCYFLARYLDSPGDGGAGVSIGELAETDLFEDWRRQREPEWQSVQNQPYLLGLPPARAVEAGCRRVTCRAAVSLPLGLAGGSRLFVVHDGILLDAIEFPHLDTGADVMLAPSGLQTDLTGLALVRNQQMEALEERAKELLRQALQGLSGIDSLPAFVPQDAAEQTMKAACCCLLGWLGLLVFAWDRYRAYSAKQNFPPKLAAAMRQRVSELLHRPNFSG